MNQRIACTAIGKRIMLGKVAKNGTDFIGTPVDVTSDVIAAIIDKFGTTQTHVIQANGVTKYEITIKDASMQRQVDKTNEQKNI